MSDTSAKSVTPMQITLLKDNGKFFKAIISSEMKAKILYGNFEKRFLDCEKMASRNVFRYFHQ